MHSKSALAVIGFALAGALACGSAMAQSATAPVPGHGRINEVNQRLQNQQNRMQNGMSRGSMNTAQEARDEKLDVNIAKRESIDEAHHNGHLTKREQHRLNRAENRNSRRIYRQKHRR